MKSRVRTGCALLLNLAIAGMAIYGIASAARHSGWSILKYYTQLSKKRLSGRMAFNFRPFAA